jgi:hypothetical protein
MNENKIWRVEILEVVEPELDENKEELDENKEELDENKEESG